MGRKTELSLKSSTICSSSWQWPPPSQFPSFTFQDSILNFPFSCESSCHRNKCFHFQKVHTSSQRSPFAQLPFQKASPRSRSRSFHLFHQNSNGNRSFSNKWCFVLNFFNNDHILLKISNPSKRVWSEYTSSGRTLNPIDTAAAYFIFVTFGIPPH